ncbi:DUF2849 domain-containing protein [Marivita hallyeonensis]|uniref:Sulfite reductase (NADPH) hemoprotein beta-component n=1 Tax=Marivita hallyeonensis TaxID=996342 RepID=A0A1M5RE48_9RHOB|nr:DUF2849 domain-containing protein [Marivita hallyeonensis]SHH24595.1 Protein of unknown function [Marivita hallyeonensis]
MPAIFTPKVVTANDLLHGDVVYLTADDQWSRRLTDAEVLTDEADAQVRLIDASARTSEVVGVYLADVAVSETGPKATHFREKFRTKGPSNYAHGKQEELR